MMVWNGRNNVSELWSVKSSMLTIAKNKAFNFLKPAGVDQNARAAILKNYPAEGNMLENAIHYSDYKRYLDEIPETLTPQSREVLRLCRQEGKLMSNLPSCWGFPVMRSKSVWSARWGLSDSVERDLGTFLTVRLLF